MVQQPPVYAFQKELEGGPTLHESPHIFVCVVGPTTLRAVFCARRVSIITDKEG